MESSQNYILSKIFQILYFYRFGVWDHSSAERKKKVCHSSESLNILLLLFVALALW